MSTAAALGDSSWVPTLLTAAAQHLPVMLLLGGLSLALFGCAPRWQPAVWAVFAVAAVSVIAGVVVLFGLMTVLVIAGITPQVTS